MDTCVNHKMAGRVRSPGSHPIDNLAVVSVPSRTIRMGRRCISSSLPTSSMAKAITPSSNALHAVSHFSSRGSGILRTRVPAHTAARPRRSATERALMRTGPPRCGGSGGSAPRLPAVPACRSARPTGRAPRSTRRTPAPGAAAGRSSPAAASTPGASSQPPTRARPLSP